jgi:hypothetical protein
MIPIHGLLLLIHLIMYLPHLLHHIALVRGGPLSTLIRTCLA